VLIFVPPELERKPIAAIGFLFPLIGAGLLGWAILTTLRWRRFGPSTFDLATPVGPGGICRGVIHTRLATDEIRSTHVTLKLTCVQRVITGSGKNRSTRENIVWREEYTVPEGQIGFGPVGASIPVQFALPADALETTAIGGSAGVFWSLAADAELPGVNLSEDFDVPVRRTGDAPVEADTTFATVVMGAPLPISPADLAATGIRIRSTAEGTEYHFAARRTLSFAAGMTVFTLIWTGALWFQVAIDVPWIFIIVTGLFDLLFLGILANLWFGSTTVTIGGGTVRRHHAVLGIGTTRVMNAGTIRSLGLRISMQTTGRSGTPYYALRATLDNGGHTDLGDGIANKRHAEWLLGEMKRAIGV